MPILQPECKQLLKNYPSLRVETFLLLRISEDPFLQNQDCSLVIWENISAFLAS
jgi:hypothetical protein